MTATGARPLARPVVREVAEDVFAYTHDRGGWCVSNAGVVAGRAGALVIDTLATEGRTRALAEFVDRHAGGPGRTILNTHHHGDHNFGNHQFGAAAIVVAHDRIRPEMIETGLALTQLWPQVEWGDVRVTLPTITFSDRVTVWVGERRVELIHVGPAAHTTNDVVAWLPEEKVLFAGDVVMSGAAPFCLFGSVRGTLDAMRKLTALGARTVVAGHGPVAGPEILTQTIRYLHWIENLAAEGKSLGLAPLELASQVELGEFEELIDAERVVGNLHVAYAELDSPEIGVPLDVLAIFDEMVTYNGGQVPQCWA
ncbi:MBL fold metallo-hydrolase [Nocardia tengchongensis]|uniref:MBL fold metallo-hydrolase n=1 Tax=Nocardia tengchongensis TaxID=2055889 RepID=UPI00369A2666